MIKIEFNEFTNSNILNAANIANYVGVEFKSRNEELAQYKANLTLVFFIMNLINAGVYICHLR